MPASTTRRRLPTAAALCAVLTLPLSGCALELLTDDEPEAAPSVTLTPNPVESPEAVPAPPAELARYYEQHLPWENCRDGLQCARLEVPLDYEKPEGRAITLSLLKVPAAGEGDPVGSLLVNPGGPGGSGIDYAAQAAMYFGDTVRENYDIIGFDPRGVGESTPVQCLSDAELDAFVASDPDPDTPAEIRESSGMLENFGEGCLETSGDLTRHVSTPEAARDMDLIRAALGEERLSYFGASYGTLLGGTYADLFPARVGRMVFDGAVDPSLTNEEMTLVQAEGFETALRSYVEHCVDDGGCFLGDSVDAGTERIRQFLDEVERRPLPGDEKRQLRIGNAVMGIWAPLYNEDYWPLLDGALASAFEGDGAGLLTLSDAYTSRGPDGYVDNSMEALYAVNCLDQERGIAPSEVPPRIPEFERVSPTFGAIFAFGLSSCHEWPVSGDRAPEALDAEGAAPILVIGTTRDPATPVEWAEAMAEQLDSGVLVRRDGDGHTGYHAGNACVDDAVESYLVAGRVPSSDVDC